MLKRLHKSKLSSRAKLIREAPDHTIHSLCECAYNVLKGNVPITTKQYKTLKPYHKHLRKLINKSVSQKSKRKTLQSGGFLGALLKPIASLLFGGL